AGTTPPTSNGGVTGRWPCGGALPAWAKRPSSSAGSTASSTCLLFEPPSTPTSRPRPSQPTCITKKKLLDHRAATQVPRNAGQPPGHQLGNFDDRPRGSSAIGV